MRTVYLDHAAATPVRKEMVEAMLPYFSDRFANPSSVYDLGSSIKEVIEEQREKVAELIGAEKDDVIFTASGAEANNVAVKGTVLANRNKGKHVIVSAIEHHSVLNSARFVERFLDFEVTFLPVDEYGLWTRSVSKVRSPLKRSWFPSCTATMRLEPSSPLRNWLRCVEKEAFYFTPMRWPPQGPSRWM